MAGFDPDPEQELVLNDLFAVRNGRAVAFETAVICARQNLKTAVAQMACLGWLFVTDQRLVVWSAHQFATAQEAFRDLDELCAAHTSLARQVRRVWRGNGDEAIELKSGQRLIFRARTKGGGRGLSGDKVVLDEAFALHPMHMGALLPTLSARPDPQVVYASSAGLADSDVLRAVRDRGRAGDDPSLAYLEWGDPGLHVGCASEACDHLVGRDGCVLDDRERWRLANPAMGRRIDPDYIAAERRALPAEEFARERLGWWDEPDTLGQQISAEQWRGLESDAAPTGSLYLAVDASPGLTSASVVAVGGGALELVERRPGVGWLVDRLRGLQERHHPESVAVDPSGPIGALIPDFEEAGLNLTILSAKDAARAPVGLVRAVTEGSFTHRGEPEFTAAVAGAKWREVGDGLRLSRKDSTVDITPLVAAAVALWAAGTAGAPPGIHPWPKELQEAWT